MIEQHEDIASILILERVSATMLSSTHSSAPLPRIAVVVGSNRRDSINRKLAQALVRLGAGKFEAAFARIDDLPMFNQDIESNLPPEVVRFKNELARADGVLIVTPEHDRSIPAALKNAIDWGARPWGKNAWIGKPAFITGTSPGAIGSALAQRHLRSVMTGLGMILLGGASPISSTSTAISATTAPRNFWRISSTALRASSPLWRRRGKRRQPSRRLCLRWRQTGCSSGVSVGGVSPCCLSGRMPLKLRSRR